jgi:tyrosine-protein kinase Etk/Wzc
VEALRSLRTSLHFALLEARNNIIMFTGPTAGLGKSFISTNLGAVLAQGGKRVVVVDADLRRGLLCRYFGAAQTPGVSNYIAENAELKTVIKKSAVERLDFIPSGTRPPNPAEILMHERFANLLNTLSRSYDFVLVDTPPILPVTDAAIVGRLAGTTLLVLKSAEHPMRAVEEAVRRLRTAGVQVRGTIFNQVGKRVGSYGYGSYGYTYGYSTQAYTSKPAK